MENKKNKFYGWWIVFSGFMMIGTIYTIIGNTAGLFIVPLSESLSATRGQVSIQITIIVLLFTVISLSVNKLISKFGIRPVMTIGGICGGIGLLSMSKVNSLISLYFSGALLGISMGLTTIVPVNIMINNWFIKKKGLVTGIVFGGSGFGGFIFTQLINYTISNYDFRMAYIVIGVITLIITVPTGLFLVRLKPEEKGQKPYGFEDNEINSEQEIKGYTLKEVKGKKTYNMLLLSIFLLTFINAAIVFQMPAHLLDSGHSMNFVATINSIFLVGLVIAKLIMGNIFDKKGGVFAFSIGSICFATASLILGVTANSTAVIAFAAIYSIAAALVTIAPPFLTSDLFGKKDYGTLFGIVTLANSLGSATGGPALGLIYDITGSYNIGWFMLVGLSAIMMICIGISYKSIVVEKIAQN